MRIYRPPPPTAADNTRAVLAGVPANKQADVHDAKTPSATSIPKLLAEQAADSQYQNPNYHGTPTADTSTITLTIGGQNYTYKVDATNNDSIDLTMLGKGFSEHNYTNSTHYIDNSDPNFKAGTLHQEGKLLAYQQNYSVVTGIALTKDEYRYDSNGKTQSGYANPNSTDFMALQLAGLQTKPTDLPKVGTLTYHGDAYSYAPNSTNQVKGTLEYTINLGNKEGTGTIDLGSVGTVKLGTASLDNLTKPESSIDLNKSVGDAVWSRTGHQDVTGRYQARLFGPKAEEIAGTVSNLEDIQVIFGGKQ